ncbi:ATP-binding protein [Streptomyces sp. NBC_01267]|uniref:ATP-binding protein n=1 Tax=unclassified Streptomyces TaxID=2593676 RepID=UPI002024A819|nr:MULTISPECIES: ATP-binding protein [unclassified Streptomyces]MCX4548681.1 ATP-binding protein [Streptomyces sp. NBC_01500]WSC20286.1 ATP-binding protein [Streptomyces sp. NBC_01766]
MKLSAAKTLGVAVVGAAFAAAAAGSASAAVAPATPDVNGTLDSVTRTLPLESVTSKLPAGAGRAVETGKTVLGSQAATLPSTVAGAVSTVLPGAAAAGQVGSLLGGLPTGAVPGLGR